MGRANRDMQAIAIMQEFGWTYAQYLDAPVHILTLIMEKMKRDRKQQEMEAKKSRR